MTGINFRDIDANGNGYIDSEDYTAFAKAVEEQVKKFDTAGGKADGYISNGKGESIIFPTPGRPAFTWTEDPTDELDNFTKNSGLPFSKDGVENATTITGGNREGYSFSHDTSSVTGYCAYDSYYCRYLWKQIGGGFSEGKSKFAIGPNLSLKDLVDKPVSWVNITEGDKKLVEDGRWDRFNGADSNGDGFIEQGHQVTDGSSPAAGTIYGHFEWSDELAKYVVAFTGAQSKDNLFTPEKQKEFREYTRGMQIKNYDQDGNWTPAENLKISDFTKLTFWDQSLTNPFSWGNYRVKWSFRDFEGYPN